MFMINEYDKTSLNYEHIKIPLVYLAMGFLWIYFSDRVVDAIIMDKDLLLDVNTYKGWFYVIVTSFVLFLLIARFLKRVSVVENELKQINAELKYLSEHDQLTGLYNRRFFEEELIELDAPENLPMAVIIGDINGVRLINDSFGHPVGDMVIKKVAEVILNAAEKQDVVCRLAGDEFIILSPRTNLEEAEERIRALKAAFVGVKVGLLDLSVSFGFEIKNSQEESIDEVIKNAEDFMYRKKLYDSPSMRGKTITTIVATLHEKNTREEQHSRRVSMLCEKMGLALGMNEDKTKELKAVGLLHDIGKIGIDEQILNKQGKLTNKEWEEIKKHPEIGYRILSTVNELSEMAEFVLAHHERWDGKGYPKGLRGEEIPLESRIIGLADAYDAMISERSYRKALTKEEAIQELRDNAGTQFNADCVAIFIDQVLKEETEDDGVSA